MFIAQVVFLLELGQADKLKVTGETDDAGVCKLVPVRRYVSAVSAIALCLFVRPSVTSQCCIKTAERIKLISAIESSLDMPCLMSQGILVSLSKIRVFPLELCHKLWTWKHFTMAC